jgi:transcriptional regulator with XRE-family HTH domain
MDINSLTAYRIKEKRKEKELNQNDVASLINLSLSAFSRLENGEVDINLKTLEKIAQVLKVSISELIYQKNIDQNFRHCNINAVFYKNNHNINIVIDKDDLNKVLTQFQ